MKNTSEINESRGVLRLEKSEEVSNTVLENSSEENDGIPTYTTENAELDDLLNEATTTKADAEQQENAEQMHGNSENSKKSKGKMSAEQAMKIAMSGLGQRIEMASELTGKQITLGKAPAILFAMLTAPVIMKYESKINIDPNEVDTDSWVPEIMALGGICTAGLPIYLQVSSNEPTGGENGDKSKHSA